MWDTSYADELGRLCQGVGHSSTHPSQPRVAGTDAFCPTYLHDIPTDDTATSPTHVVGKIRLQKEDPNRTRITIGGNRICYPGDWGTKTSSLKFKLLINCAISTPDVRFACFGIKNFCLGMPLDHPEYVQIKLTNIPQEFVDEYDLTQNSEMSIKAQVKEGTQP